MTITPERLAELAEEAKKLLLFGTKSRKDYFVRHLAREMLVLTKQDPELPQVWHGDLTDMVGDLLLRDATEGLHVGPLGAARKRVADLESENARLREALKEIQELESYIETKDALSGLRCGVEDRDLQGLAYDAAEYGFNQCAGRAAHIATAALKGAST